MAGNVDHDLFVVLRHVGTSESSHFGASEGEFTTTDLNPFVKDGLFLCELPSLDPVAVVSQFLIPVGPTDVERECAMLSMFHGVFTGISMIKGSLRGYTHVMKTRTDYLPWNAPWIPKMLETYEQWDRKIIVDGTVTIPSRYPDRPDIPWQGSICDVFCFASVDQFCSLWDFGPILSKVWTGIPETTLFRAAMTRFLGDDLQSHRRNESFLNKHFAWPHNDTKQSFHLLRSGILSDHIKQTICNLVENKELAAGSANRLIRASYDFIIGSTVKLGGLEPAVQDQLTRPSYPSEAELKQVVESCPPDSITRVFFLKSIFSSKKLVFVLAKIPEHLFINSFTLLLKDTLSCFRLDIMS